MQVKYTVYILEGNFFVSQAIARLAQKYDFNATPVRSLATALGNGQMALKNCTVDAVIADTEIGARTTEDFIWHASRGLLLPTICLTSDARSETRMERAGCTFYVRKPAVARDIFPRLYALLRHTGEKS